jgi:hypothetical protein
VKALVTRLDSFGDVLLAGPAVRAVAARADTVTLLCGPQGAPAAGLLPGVDEVLVWESPWTGLQPPPVDREDIDALLAAVAATRTDTALVLTSFHQSPLPTALLLRLAGVRFIAADSEDYPGSLLDVRHHRAPHAHEAEAMLDLAEADGRGREADPGRVPDEDVVHAGQQPGGGRATRSAQQGDRVGAGGDGTDRGPGEQHVAEAVETGHEGSHRGLRPVVWPWASPKPPVPAKPPVSPEPVVSPVSKAASM